MVSIPDYCNEAIMTVEQEKNRWDEEVVKPSTAKFKDAKRSS